MILPRFLVACAILCVAGPAHAAVWAGPVVDDRTDAVDAAVDEPFRAAVRLLERDDWHAGAPSADCKDCRRITIRGHRAPDVRFTLVLLDAAGSRLRDATVATSDAIAPFDLAQALALNCLFLVGDQRPPWIVAQTVPRPAPKWFVAVGPTATRSVGGELSTWGSELALGWHAPLGIDVTLSGGFEAFGRGSNPLGSYQYRVGSVALLAGTHWDHGPWRLGVAAGVRVATYQFEFQTSHLGESSDTSVAFVGEARVQRQLQDRLFVGLAARPMLATDATSIGPEGETDVYDEPPFTVQLAVMLGVEL